MRFNGFARKVYKGNHVMEKITITALAVCVIANLTCLGSAGEILPACEAPGGIAVYLGNADLEKLKDLHAEGRFTVQALDRDAKRVDDLRKGISAAGLYGPVSVRVLSGDRLPYVNDLVNMVVADDMLGLTEEEVLRVVCPLGRVRIRSDETWKTITKPWPDDIDEWTHFLHNPTGNAVVTDERIGTPRRIQWFGLPGTCSIKSRWYLSLF